jgi:small multidrug resistance pump
MAWILLIISIVLEVCGTTCMKLSNGFSRPLPSVLVFAFYAACFTVFMFAVKKIEISTAYAIWSGLGMALIAAIGVTYFRENISTLKIIGLLLVIAGVAALSIADKTAD